MTSAPLPPQLDFWHPVALSDAVRPGEPLARRLLGIDLVLFRAAPGGPVGCLRDACPHRGMPLSHGATEGGRLVCPYHGYAYDRLGRGLTPGSPRRVVCAAHLDVVERRGAVWVKRAGAAAALPEWTRGGLVPQTVLRREIGAPLELVLDNFTEVEHTPSVHAFLGYRKADMPQVTCRLELTGDTVRVINEGPQKPLPWVLRKLMDFRAGDLFVDDWTTWFTPPHAVYAHFWRDPATGQPRPDKLVTAVHLTPIDERRTALFAFASGAGPRADNPLWRMVLGPITRRVVSVEVERDAALLDKLGDTAKTLRGRKLSRFDKALVENRKRLDRLYWGRRPELTAVGRNEGR